MARCNEFLSLNGILGYIGPDHGHDEGRPGKAIHPQGPNRIPDRGLGLVMADQHKGTEGGHLEEHVHKDNIVGKDKAVHGPYYHYKKGEENGLSGFFKFLVCLVFVHVRDGEHTDK